MLKIKTPVRGNKLLSIIAASIVGVGASIIMPASSMAATLGVNSPCINHVTHSAGNPVWGKGHVCITNVYADGNGNYFRNVSITLQDVLTDGHCVHAEARYNNSWTYALDDQDKPIQNCGGVTPPSSQAHYSSDLQEIRIVRGTVGEQAPDGAGPVGNYFRIWPD